MKDIHIYILISYEISINNFHFSLFLVIYLWHHVVELHLMTLVDIIQHHLSLLVKS